MEYQRAAEVTEIAPRSGPNCSALRELVAKGFLRRKHSGFREIPLNEDIP
jgi:hypothetical protein